jgi:hypothetical protein
MYTCKSGRFLQTNATSYLHPHYLRGCQHTYLIGAFLMKLKSSSKRELNSILGLKNGG